MEETTKGIDKQAMKGIDKQAVIGINKQTNKEIFKETEKRNVNYLQKALKNITLVLLEPYLINKTILRTERNRFFTCFLKAFVLI